MKKLWHIFFVAITILSLYSCKVTGFTISQTEATIGLGESLKIEGTILPTNATKNVISWSSSDITVASVDGTGFVVGEGVGTATITARTLEGGFRQSCTVTVVSQVSLSANDLHVCAVGKTISYKFFESEEEFLSRVLAFNRVSLKNVKATDFTVEAVEYDENSIWKKIEENAFLKVGEKVPESFFGVEKKIENASDATYNAVISMTLSCNNVKIPFVWNYKNGNGTVEIATNKFNITNANFKISDINAAEKSAKITLTGFQAALKAAENNGSGSGNGTIKVSYKLGESEVGCCDDSTSISDSIEVTVSNLKAGENSISVAIEFNLTSSSDPKPTMVLNADLSVSIPLDSEVKKKAIEISPVAVSIARCSDKMGVIEADGKASVLLNYGAEMEVALVELLGSDYRNWDFDNATWCANIARAENGDSVATVTNAPYKKRHTFSLSLSEVYKLKVLNGKLFVPSKAQSNLSLEIDLNWGSDAVWGDSIEVKNVADFPQSLKFDKDGLKTNEGGTEYELIFGDDFNYHFNGLNYKNYASYNISRRAGFDEESARYSTWWDSEGSSPQHRHDAAWDIRNTETKNGRLLSKMLGYDPATGTIFLGNKKTKPLAGFNDLIPSKNIIAGATRSKTVRFGYVEGKVRVKNKAYNKYKVTGPWYAFWLHGEMHEYDMMEYCNGDTICEMVIHWHNGWGGYGKNPGKSWFRYKVPKDWENEWWLLGLYWDENQVVYTYNDKPFLRLTRNEDNSKVFFDVTNNGWAMLNGWRRTFTTPTRFGADLNPQIARTSTPISYGEKRLKAIMDVPMNIFASTEIGVPTWGGAFTAGIGGFPTWLEVDYIAYYLPKNRAK